MACREYERRLAELEDYLEGALAPSAAQAVEAHLAGCGDCREAVAAAREATLLLREGLEAAGEPSPFFWARLRAHLRAVPAPTMGEFWQSLEVLARRLAWTAALGVVVLGGYVAAFDLPQRHAPPAPVATETRELFPEPAQRPADHEEVLVVLSDRNGPPR